MCPRHRRREHLSRSNPVLHPRVAPVGSSAWGGLSRPIPAHDAPACPHRPVRAALDLVVRVLDASVPLLHPDQGIWDVSPRRLRGRAAGRRGRRAPRREPLADNRSLPRPARARRVARGCRQPGFARDGRTLGLHDVCGPSPRVRAASRQPGPFGRPPDLAHRGHDRRGGRRVRDRADPHAERLPRPRDRASRRSPRGTPAPRPRGAVRDRRVLRPHAARRAGPSHVGHESEGRHDERPRGDVEGRRHDDPGAAALRRRSGAREGAVPRLPRERLGGGPAGTPPQQRRDDRRGDRDPVTPGLSLVRRRLLRGGAPPGARFDAR